jgi:hypothetical protein
VDSHADVHGEHEPASCGPLGAGDDAVYTVGVERQGYRLSLSHITEGEWRAVFMGPNPLLAPKGFGVAPTPWEAVQDAARRVVNQAE